jgi:hypothetical protein
MRRRDPTLTFSINTFSMINFKLQPIFFCAGAYGPNQDPEGYRVHIDPALIKYGTGLVPNNVQHSSPLTMPFDLSKESTEGYCKVFDGVFVVSEYHRPGYSQLMPRLTNRGFVFVADNAKNGKHLMMSGIPGDECIPKVQAIEKDTGLELKKIITSGDFHHMAMKDWVRGVQVFAVEFSFSRGIITSNQPTVLSSSQYISSWTHTPTPSLSIHPSNFQTLATVQKSWQRKNTRVASS